MTHDFEEIQTRRSPSAAEAIGISRDRCNHLDQLLELDYQNFKPSSSESSFDIVESLMKRIKKDDLTTRDLLWYIYIGYSNQYHVHMIIEDKTRFYRIFTPIGVGGCIFTFITLIYALVR